MKVFFCEVRYVRKVLTIKDLEFIVNGRLREISFNAKMIDRGYVSNGE